MGLVGKRAGRTRNAATAVRNVPARNTGTYLERARPDLLIQWAHSTHRESRCNLRGEGVCGHLDQGPGRARDNGGGFDVIQALSWRTIDRAARAAAGKRSSIIRANNVSSEPTAADTGPNRPRASVPAPTRDKMIANVAHRGSLCSRWIWGFVTISALLSCAANAGGSTNETRRSDPYSMSDKNKNEGEEPSRECETKFAAFVEDLDELLAKDPATVYPVFDLLKKYFPVEGCNIESAIRISRRSQFFSHVSEEKTYYIVAFDSRGFAGPLDPGFHVQISLLKASGNSRLPAAHVNQ